MKTKSNLLLVLLILLTTATISAFFMLAAYKYYRENIGLRLYLQTLAPKESSQIIPVYDNTKFFTQVDTKRRSHEICGYDAQIQNLFILNNQQDNLQYTPGIWSPDCNIHVYGIGLKDPVDTVNAFENIGIWMYDTKTKKNTLLLQAEPNNPYPQVIRFISKNIVIAAGKIIDVDKQVVIDDVPSTVTLE